jgi:hypothetical protein
MTPQPRQQPAVLDEIEPTLTVAHIALKWQLSEDAVRRLFQNEEGVLRFGHETLRHGRKYRRRYFSLRIPMSVFLRVQDRLQQRKRA